MDIEKFCAKFEVNPVTLCWEWTAYLTQAGYPQIGEHRAVRPAHRVGYEWFVGPIPSGLELDHLCRNTKCVNPDHLEPVTGAENLRRARAARLVERTHCPKGHPYDEGNTRWKNGKYRECKTCKRASDAAYGKANRGRIRAWAAEYRDRTRDRQREYFADYRAKNREAINERTRRWHESRAQQTGQEQQTSLES